MKNKGISLLIILLIYIIAFGSGEVSLIFFPSFLNPLLSLFLADVIATVVVFIFNLIFKNASVYDPYWSVQPVFIIAAMYLHYGKSFQITHLFILIPLGIWSVRLTLNWIAGFENLSWEDWRYRELKSKNLRFSHFIVFTGIMLMPTCLVFLGTIPVWFLLRVKTLNPILPAAGGIIILTGVCFEYLADSRMRRYKKNPNRSPYIDEGLWRYSRHPNYFGEILIWVGIFTAGLVNFKPLSLAGVLLITLLFIFISAPMMEKHILKKQEEYAVYRNTVPPIVFGPRRPQ